MATAAPHSHFHERRLSERRRFAYPAITADVAGSLLPDKGERKAQFFKNLQDAPRVG